MKCIICNKQVWYKCSKGDLCRKHSNMLGYIMLANSELTRTEAVQELKQKYEK